MPWSRGVEEDQRFRKSLGTSLAVSFAIAFLFTTIALPIINRSVIDELPERVARIVRQERAIPPPVEEPPIPEQELPDPDPEELEETPPEERLQPVEEPMLAETPTDTREQVKSRGILAFRESFASAANLRPAAQLGSRASISAAGEDAVGRPQRMMVATSAPGSSGGINLANVSRDVGGGGPGMDGVEVGKVSSSIGGAEGPARPLSGGVFAGRTDEEIQIVFDRYKAALYRLYNRELRKDPTLRGQLVLRLTIEPDGSVSLCQLHSSSMDATVLADQVVERVLTFDFGAKEDIVAMTIIYPIDFLPAA
jgi:outer membrane biosynthesis protein TonB